MDWINLCYIRLADGVGITCPARSIGGRCSGNLELSQEASEDPSEVLQAVAEGLQAVLAVI